MKFDLQFFAQSRSDHFKDDEFCAKWGQGRLFFYSTNISTANYMQALYLDNWLESEENAPSSRVRMWQNVPQSSLLTSPSPKKFSLTKHSKNDSGARQ